MPLTASNRTYYELTGNGPTRILLTMGLGGSLDQWEAQLQYFGQRAGTYTVCAYDNRGVGLSLAPAGRWTTRHLAQDGIALLDDLGWTENVHLVGLSMGGMVTQELALLDLPRFSSVSLIR